MGVDTQASCSSSLATPPTPERVLIDLADLRRWSAGSRPIRSRGRTTETIVFVRSAFVEICCQMPVLDSGCLAACGTPSKPSS